MDSIAGLKDKLMLISKEELVEELIGALIKVAEPRGATSKAANPEYYLAIAEAEIDTCDGTMKPTLEYVLLRGFAAMGWAQPSKAADEIIEAAASAVCSAEAKQ